MFDSILHAVSPAPSPLTDAGAIAESLIFYGKVRIAGNSAVLQNALKIIPPFVLLDLMRSGRIELYYLGDQVGVASQVISGGRNIHDLVTLSSPDHTIEKIAAKAFQHSVGRLGSAVAGSYEFESLVRSINHSDFDQRSIEEVLLNQSRTKHIASAVLEVVAPEYANSVNVEFGIERSSLGLEVHTNIDFEAVNKIYHHHVAPSHSSINEAFIIARIQAVYDKAYLAGSLESEIFLDPREQIVLSRVISNLIEASSLSENQLQKFLEFTLGSGRAIREAINSGEVEFKSVVQILKRADHFREWLRNQTPDSNLVEEFYLATTRDSWAERLPTKSIRFTIFTGLGLAADALVTGGFGTAAGIGLGVIDSFLIDKLIGGWKPHQFINQDLRPVFRPSVHRKAIKGFGR